MVDQLKKEKVSNHGSITVTIVCNVLASIVFKEAMASSFRVNVVQNVVSRIICSDGVRDSNRIIIFKINLHNLEALFRRQSIHVEMPN